MEKPAIALFFRKLMSRTNLPCSGQSMAPGLIHTPMFDSFPEKVVTSLSESVPNPSRLGYADEIAHLAQFIVENNYINGETIRADGAIRLQPR